MKVNCLDTYALWEIMLENPKYSVLINEKFVVTNWTLIEFYKTLLRQFDKQTAVMWHKRFYPYSKDVNSDLLIKSVDFQHENKKENFSLFGCVGYIFAQQNDFVFVTGDKSFKNKQGVLFIQK